MHPIHHTFPNAAVIPTQQDHKGMRRVQKEHDRIATLIQEMHAGQQTREADADDKPRVPDR